MKNISFRCFEDMYVNGTESELQTVKFILPFHKKELIY
jgi:hypothetical protein